jgi:hypothetical protein
MKIGIILLSKNDYYMDEKGCLPSRPTFDKKFITDFIEGKKVLCSIKTMRSLPESMLSKAYFTTDINSDYDINFGIDTFSKARPDILIVIRSQVNIVSGYKFRMSQWSNFYRTKNMEMWK